MRILIAEDDPSTRLLLEDRLAKWGFQPVSVADGTEAWEILQSCDRPGLALLDRRMPGIEGTEVCRRVRQREENEEAYTYLILVTARRSARQVVEGLESGADDYLVKPFDELELRARVLTGRRIIRLHTDLMAAKQALSVQARTDPLTGALNRRGILSQLESELNRASRGKKRLSLILLDLDRFKEVNDEFGHLAGDAALRGCVERVGLVTRSYDFVGRLGGDEFLILLPETGGAEALAVCYRIREMVATEPVSFEGTPIGLTVSLGVAEVDVKGTVDEVIDMADRALLRAKKEGRGGVVRSQGDRPG